MPFKSSTIENVGRAINQTARKIFYWAAGIVVGLVILAVLAGWALGR